MELPIDVVPGTNPPRFRWRQSVEHGAGRSVQEFDGILPPSVERAVAELIALAKQQARDIAALRNTIRGLTDRIAAQSEVLSKRAETPTPTPTVAHPKKGKG